MEAAKETDSEANMFLGKITYKTKSDGICKLPTGKATFIDSVSDTYFTDAAKEISPTPALSTSCLSDRSRTTLRTL